MARFGQRTAGAAARPGGPHGAASQAVWAAGVLAAAMALVAPGAGGAAGPVANQRRPAGDPNSPAEANKPAAEMRLDAFLSRFGYLVEEYKEANAPAKKDQVLGEIRKAIQTRVQEIVLTMSGQVADVKVQKDGSVGVTLASVEELQGLRGKPLEGLFRSGAAEWAQGGFLYLKMKPEQAAGIKKGDKWLLRGRPVFQTDDPDSVQPRLIIHVYMSTLTRIVRFTSEKSIPVGELAFPKYTCTINGATYESAGGE